MAEGKIYISILLSPMKIRSSESHCETSETGTTIAMGRSGTWPLDSARPQKNGRLAKMGWVSCLRALSDGGHDAALQECGWGDTRRLIRGARVPAPSQWHSESAAV